VAYMLWLLSLVLYCVLAESFEHCPIYHPGQYHFRSPCQVNTRCRLGIPNVSFLAFNRGTVICLEAYGKAESTGLSSSHERARATKNQTEIDQQMPLLEISPVAKISTSCKTTASANKSKVKSKSSDNAVKKTKKKRNENEVHWRLDSDMATFVGESSNHDTRKEATLVRFTVRGNPLPLRRHRTARGIMYNPSAKYQASFRNVTLQSLNSIPHALSKDDLTNTTFLPLFLSEQPLIVSILFRMKRPKSHFIGGKPGWGRLRGNAPLQTSVVRTDVDNLAKFVLDSMNGILYEDDRQVCSLHITKVLDNEDQCLGSTSIWCRQFTLSDVDNLPGII
jgi:Endodeoxyribonuclease RusA